ncbi:carboxymuconolactone decarboxylase family protein [Acinetobacter larvae]|uniref:Alkylhydroperoxidase n=1 Tax=Acinetobacter larvae TaxID=1789224 RepID=A0A1B2M2P3_9GAMM|nr:carboxymuconolactone decarboxylase family protein [Acinetobacter larvae]AOA59468.1 alkylhydroperoxidase [Acinetobacter larvae]
MSYFAPLRIDQAATALQQRLTTAQQQNGFHSNLLGVLAYSAQALQSYQFLGEINAQSSLNVAQREVVQLVAATHNGCRFCVAGHSALAKHKAKMTAQSIQALRLRQSLADPALNALADFAGLVLQHKGAVATAQIEAFFAAGYSQQQALDVLLGLSLATLCNYANNLARTPLNSQLSAYQWEPADA